MYKFKPVLKSVIWGGEKIAPYKGIVTSQTNIGESWELSAVEGDESVVAEGEYRGMTMPGLIGTLREELVGRSVYARFGNEFPLLVKFIDAHRDLSIQVHPDDALCAARHGKRGKTEMWYVVAADEGARLSSGFSRKVTPEEYNSRVADNTITAILQDYTVRPGDVFFLPAGRIHTIGAGTFLVEIQQTSDVTYRIYDYGRTDADGKPRELHTNLAKDAIDYTVLPDYRTAYTPTKNAPVRLAACEHFITDLYDLTEPVTVDLSVLDSFLVVICMEGSGTIEDDKGSTTLRQGETVLVPASSRHLLLKPRTAMKLLTSHL